MFLYYSINTISASLFKQHPSHFSAPYPAQVIPPHSCPSNYLNVGSFDHAKFGVSYIFRKAMIKDGIAMNHTYTLLSKEQVFGEAPIDVIRALGAKCGVTDFGIISGADVDD